MELNRTARQWLRTHRRDLYERDDIIILSAQPHPFIFTRNGREFTYERWSWNIHVHGNLRAQLKDFLLMQMDGEGKLIGKFLVPGDRAIKSKTIALYTGGKRQRRSWIKEFKID